LGFGVTQNDVGEGAGYGVLALSLTGAGPSGPALTYMQIPLKVQKVHCKKIGEK